MSIYTWTHYMLLSMYIMLEIFPANNIAHKWQQIVKVDTYP